MELPVVNDMDPEGKPLHFSAHMAEADGSPWPSWLKFDPEKMVFLGQSKKRAENSHGCIVLPFFRDRCSWCCDAEGFHDAEGFLGLWLR